MNRWRVLVCIAFAATAASAMAQVLADLSQAGQVVDTEVAARAGAVLVVFERDGQCRLAANGQLLDSAELIALAGLSPTQQWFAYWRLADGAWQLVLRSFNGQRVVSDSFDAIFTTDVDTDAPWHFGRCSASWRWCEGEVEVGPTTLHAWMDGAGGIVYGRRADWTSAACAHVAVADGAAYFAVGNRGPTKSKLIASMQFCGIPEPPADFDWETADPADLTAGPNGTMAVLFQRGDRYFIRVGDHEVAGTETKPSEVTLSPNARHWAVAYRSDSGRLCVAVDGRNYRTDVRISEGTDMWVDALSDNGRVLFVSTDANDRFQLYKLDIGHRELTKLFTSDGIVQKVACSADGSVWAAAVELEDEWLVRTANRRWRLGDILAVDEIAVSPDGSHVVWLVPRPMELNTLYVDGQQLKMPSGEDPFSIWLESSTRLRVITFKNGKYRLRHISLAE